MHIIREELYFYIFWVIFNVLLNAGDLFNWICRVVKIEYFTEEGQFGLSYLIFQDLEAVYLLLTLQNTKMGCFCLASLS